MTPEEAVAAVNAVDDIEVIRATAKDLEIPFSGNSGIDTIKGKIVEYLKEQTIPTTSPDALAAISGGEDEEIEVAKAIPAGPTIEELLEMDPAKVEDVNLRRKVVRAKALRLVRVNITNLDPSEAQLDSVLITATNKYTGKVSRVVPFNVDWHVEEILLNQMKNQKFVMRREKKGPGQKFGIKQYDTGYVKKYQIEVLPMLTPEELERLAADQRAAGSIDK